MVKDLLVDRKADRRASLVKSMLYAAVIFVPMIFWAGPAARSAFVSLFWEPPEQVAIVKLQGEMKEGALASGSKLVPALRKAFSAPNVQAVVLEIDSPGGSPLEAERIYSVIDAERKKNGKPVIAVINNIGASAAYMVAMHCDQVYAGQYSLVGSIGAIISTWDFHRALQRVDVAQRVYASGELKAMLNPYLAGSDAADKKASELVHDIARRFVTDLVERRGRKLSKEVDFSTGEVWGGAAAKTIGLVDEVGTVDEILRQRWPGATPRVYGVSDGNPFSPSEAVSEWLRTTIWGALEPRVALQ